MLFCLESSTDSSSQYLLCGMLKSSSNCCDTGFRTMTKLDIKCSVIRANTISTVTLDGLRWLCCMLTRMFGSMSLPYVTKPRMETGKYIPITAMYANTTDTGNLEDLFMSVWMVGNVDAPPKENRIVPNARKVERKIIETTFRKIWEGRHPAF